MLSGLRSTLGRVRIGPGRVVLIAVALLAVAGCGSDDEPSGGDAGGSVAGSARLADAIVYSRGGGIAGRSYRLTLQPDGSGTLETRGAARKDVTLKAAEVSGLADAVAAADVPALKARYAPATARPDGFAHRVEVAGRTVTVQDGSTAPKPVQVLVARLSGLVDEYAA